MLKSNKYIHIHRFVIIPSEKENKQLEIRLIRTDKSEVLCKKLEEGVD